MYRKYNKTKKRTNTDVIGGLLVLSQAERRRLDNIRKSYGDPPSEPAPLDFGLSGQKIEEISQYNIEIEKENKELEKRERAYFFVSSVLVYFIICYLFKGYPSFFGPWLFYGLFLSPVVSKYLVEKLDLKKRKVGHEMTEQFERYKYLKSDFLRSRDEFNNLVIKEQQDKLTRQRSEFWFSLNGIEFEKEMADQFRRLGYLVEQTRATGDGGIDLILTDDLGEKTVVQCKAHKKQVGPSVVRDLYGAMHDFGARNAILVSLGGFTAGVFDFAKKNNIQLFDIKKVLEIEAIEV